jgi:hypothetical protein
MVSAEQRSPFASPPYKAFVTTTGCSVPALRFGAVFASSFSEEYMRAYSKGGIARSWSFVAPGSTRRSFFNCK